MQSYHVCHQQNACNEEESIGNYSWRIVQGVEMGQPSVLDARTEKREGVVAKIWIDGDCVLVSEGVLESG
jgi:trans-2,3-dihydro-3-hydroxyanthranilate isomerase